MKKSHGKEIVCGTSVGVLHTPHTLWFGFYTPPHTLVAHASSLFMGPHMATHSSAFSHHPLPLYLLCSWTRCCYAAPCPRTLQFTWRQHRRAVLLKAALLRAPLRAAQRARRRLPLFLPSPFLLPRGSAPRCLYSGYDVVGSSM